MPYDKIVFQRIQKSQVVHKGSGFRIFANNNTLSVYADDNVFYPSNNYIAFPFHGNLLFNSMYYARQVFDMGVHTFCMQQMMIYENFQILIFSLVESNNTFLYCRSKHKRKNQINTKQWDIRLSYGYEY